MLRRKMTEAIISVKKMYVEGKWEEEDLKRQEKGDVIRK